VHVRLGYSPSLVKIGVSKSTFSVIAMTVLWLDPLSILVLCINLVEIVQICSVLMSWILSAVDLSFTFYATLSN
jgi:hypothetical protein